MIARWVPQSSGMEGSTLSLVPSVDALFDAAFSDGERSPTGRWPRVPLGDGAESAETENEIQLSVDLPGYDPKSLKVKLKGDTLTIQAEGKKRFTEKVRAYLSTEREYGRYARSFVLPNTIDGSNCQADYEHGVLTVTLPKRDEAKPRTVDIRIHS